jgi:glycine cleavage system aminomethyltransferase T
MNRTQTAIWHLGVEDMTTPDFNGFTDVTESTVFLALFGPDAFHVAEKLTALDLMDPARTVPFLLQGPLCHVPCQIVILERHADLSGGFVMTCSRGYADSMVQAILDSGQEFGLRPAGETRFVNWVRKLQNETSN